MIDLNKLNKKLNSALEQETTESLNNWIDRNMTPERQNEIWQELPTDFKEQLCYDYEQANVALLQDPKNVRIDAHIRFLEELFGRHNLTAKAEEKPKEP